MKTSAAAVRETKQPRHRGVLAVVAEKGGTGKTTTAENLAVEAATAGETVILIDIDGQISATKWFGRRQPDEEAQENENPKVVSAQPARLKETVDTAKRVGGATFIVIDCPGHNSPAMTAAARVADFVLVPTKPEIGDVETLGLVRDALMLGGNPPALVSWGQAPVQGEYEKTWETVVKQEYGFDTCPVVFHIRRDFANARVSGRTAAEIEPAGRAAEEARALYKFVCEQLNKFKS